MGDSDFSKNRDEWKRLMTSGEYIKAEKLYWERMFPHIEKRFVGDVERRKLKGEIESYDCLIIPGGLWDIYYILLIKALKPKFVYFIFTKEGERHFLDNILEKTGLSRNQYILDVIEYRGMDVTDVYERVKSKLNLFEGKKVALDITQGKRVMAVGAGIVGAFFNFDLVYVDEDWMDELKRGVPGTEELVRVKNPFEVFGDLKQQQSIMLFNRYDYSAATTLFSDLLNKVKDPREFEIKMLIADTYNYWDAFNYNAALSKLERAVSKIRQYDFKSFDRERMEKNLQILKKLAKVKENFISFLKDKDLVLHFLMDMYMNALRRKKLNRLEDAVIRMYRCLEVVSQHRLALKGVDSKRPDFSKMPDILEKYGRLTKEMYGIKKKALPNEIGIKDGHLILFLLQDELWKGTSETDLKKFLGPIRLRDNSIIAHGNELIGEKAFDTINKTCKHMILRLCQIYKKDFKTITDYHTFIELG